MSQPIVEASKRTLGARNRLPVNAGPVSSCEFLPLSEEPLRKDEALSEHYLDVLIGPTPPCTRTRSRSSAGPPPAWMRGAHGEQVKVTGVASRGGRKLRREILNSEVFEPVEANEEGRSTEIDFSEAVAAILEKVNPQIAEITNAIITTMGLEHTPDVASVTEDETRRAVEELNRLAKEAEVDPFEGIETLQAVLFKAGCSIPEVAMVIQHMRVQLVRLAFEEYTGGGSKLESMMRMCEEVREKVSRSEFICNTYLCKVRTGGYESLVNRINSVDTLPGGLSEAQDKVLQSVTDFHMELLGFASLLWKHLRFEKEIARDTFDQVRDEALAEKRAAECYEACETYRANREQLTHRLEIKYMAFHKAHMRIHEEITNLQQIAKETEANNLRHEEDIDEWQRRLALLEEQKERRAGNYDKQDRILEETLQEMRHKLKLKVHEIDFIGGEMDKLKADTEKMSADLEGMLVVICIREWHKKLLDHSKHATQCREMKALMVEDLLVVGARLAERLDVEKLKQAVRAKQKLLQEQSEMKDVWQNRLEHHRHHLEFSLESMMEVESWLQDHNLKWEANHTDGKLVHEAPMTTPLFLRRVFEDLMTRRARRRYCMGDWFHTNSTRWSESPAGDCQKAAVAICDERRLARTAPTSSKWRVCLVGSFSMPSLSLEGQLTIPPCVPSMPRLGTNSLLWQSLRQQCRNNVSHTEQPCTDAHSSKGHSLIRVSSKKDSLGLEKSVRKDLGLLDFGTVHRDTEKPKDMRQASPWQYIQDRWMALWSTAQELCRGDVACTGDILHFRQTSIPRPWTRQMLSRMYALIMDGFSCVTALENLESMLLFVEQLNMNDVAVNPVLLGKSEEEFSDTLGNVLQREWSLLSEWAAGCEERQRAIASILSAFTDIQARLEVLASNACFVGVQAEDFAFSARMLTATRRAGDDRTPMALDEQQKMMRLVVAGLVSEARTLRAEADALLDVGGYIANLQTMPLCTKAVKEEPGRFMNLVNDALQAHTQHLKDRIDSERKRIEKEREAIEMKYDMEQRDKKRAAAKEDKETESAEHTVEAPVRPVEAEAKPKPKPRPAPPKKRPRPASPRSPTPPTVSQESEDPKELLKRAMLDKAMLMKFNKAIGGTSSLKLTQRRDSGQVVVEKTDTEKSKSPSNSKTNKDKKRTSMPKRTPPSSPPPAPLLPGEDGPVEDLDESQTQMKTGDKLRSGGEKILTLLKMQRAHEQEAAAQPTSPHSKAEQVGASPLSAIRRGSTRDSLGTESSISGGSPDCSKSPTCPSPRSLKKVFRDGALGIEVLGMIKGSASKKHQVSRENTLSADGVQNLSSSFNESYDESSVELNKNDGNDVASALPTIVSPAPLEVVVAVKRRTSPDTNCRASLLLRNHLVEGDKEPKRRTFGNHMESLMMPWVTCDPAQLKIGYEDHEVPEEACQEAPATQDDESAEAPLGSLRKPPPEWTPREPLEKPTGWNTNLRQEDFESELNPSGGFADERRPYRPARPSSAGQPSAGDQDLIDFDDVDVPIYLPARAATPLWIQNMVRQVQSASPSTDVPGLQFDSQAIPSDLFDTCDAPSIGSTPLPPGLAYGSHLFDVSRTHPSSIPSSRASRKTPLLYGVESQPRVSKNLWLPTWGADAHKASGSRMPALLARKFGVDSRGCSMSPERDTPQEFVERRPQKERRARRPSPQRPCTVPPGQLLRRPSSSSRERASEGIARECPTADRPSTSMAGFTSLKRSEEASRDHRASTSMSGFIGSMFASNASKLPGNRPTERAPSGPPSRARCGTQCSTEEPVSPLPPMSYMCESPYNSSQNPMTDSPYTVRTSSRGANWLPTAHAEGRNIDSALSAVNHEQNDHYDAQVARKIGKVHVLARPFVGQMKTSVSFGVKPQPSSAIQEHRQLHSRKSMVIASGNV